MNRLTSATVAGSTETYAYDGDGLRFSRQVGTDPAVRHVSDVNASLPVIVDDGTRKYVWGNGLAYAVNGTSIQVYQPDRLGSVRELTDATGAVVATYRFDEWGIPTQGTGTSAQPFRFTGEPLDSSGLTYLRARYYDPSLGIFTMRDTWSGSFASPMTLNRYAYATGNPTTFTDPSGHYVDTVLDVVFIGYDLVSLAFGPEKERETNWLALAADVGAALLPGVTGAGIIVRLGRTAERAVLDARVLGRGVTADLAHGSTLARSLREQLAIETAIANPRAGRAIPIKMSDPRWPASEGWVKMQQILEPGGEPIKIHYVLHTVTGEIDDFKIVFWSGVP